MSTYQIGDRVRIVARNITGAGLIGTITDVYDYEGPPLPSDRYQTAYDVTTDAGTSFLFSGDLERAEQGGLVYDESGFALGQAVKP